MTKEEIKTEVNALYEQYQALKTLEAETIEEINKHQNNFILERGKFEDRIKALTKEMGMHEKDHIIVMLKGLIND